MRTHLTVFFLVLAPFFAGTAGAETLRVLWRVATATAPLPPVALENGEVYLVANRDRLLILDAASGETTREVDLPGYAVEMLAHGNTVLVRTGDGRLLSLTEGGPLTFLACLPAPTTVGVGIGVGRVVAALADGTLRAFAVSDGSELWSAELAGDGIARPVIGATHASVALNGGLVELVSIENGTSLGVIELGGDAEVGGVEFDGYLVAGAPGRRLQGIRLRDAKTKWRSEIGRGPSADLVAGDESVFVATLAGQIIALKKNGNPRWRVAVTSRVELAPVIVGRHLVVVPSRDRKILGFDQRRGTPTLSGTVPGTLTWITSPPTVAGDVMVVSVRVADGHELVALTTRPKKSPDTPTE